MEVHVPDTYGLKKFLCRIMLNMEENSTPHTTGNIMNLYYQPTSKMTETQKFHADKCSHKTGVIPLRQALELSIHLMDNSSCVLNVAIWERMERGRKKIRYHEWQAVRELRWLAKAAFKGLLLSINSSCSENTSVKSRFNNSTSEKGHLNNPQCSHSCQLMVFVRLEEERVSNFEDPLLRFDMIPYLLELRYGNWYDAKTACNQHKYHLPLLDYKLTRSLLHNIQCSMLTDGHHALSHGSFYGLHKNYKVGFQLIQSLYQH